MCLIEADSINIVKSVDTKFVNNCGPGAITNDPLAGKTPGTPGTSSTPGTTSTPGTSSTSSTSSTSGTTETVGPTGTPGTTGIKDCKKSKCLTLQEQLKNKYFNYNDLNDNNKNIFIGLICSIILLFFFIIYMASSD